MLVILTAVEDDDCLLCSLGLQLSCITSAFKKLYNDVTSASFTENSSAASDWFLNDKEEKCKPINPIMQLSRVALGFLYKIALSLHNEFTNTLITSEIFIAQPYVLSLVTGPCS